MHFQVRSHPVLGQFVEHRNKRLRSTNEPASCPEREENKCTAWWGRAQRSGVEKDLGMVEAQAAHEATKLARSTQAHYIDATPGEAYASDYCHDDGEDTQVPRPTPVCWSSAPGTHGVWAVRATPDPFPHPLPFSQAPKQTTWFIDDFQ